MKKQEIFQRYYSYSSHIEKVVQTIKPFIDIDYVFYAELYPNIEKIYMISNNFQATEAILNIGSFSEEHNHFLHNEISEDRGVFIWPDIIEKNNLVGKSLRSMGIKSGLSIIYKEGNLIKNIGFASSSKPNNLLSVTINNPEILHHFVKYFESECQDILSQKNNNLLPFNVSYLKNLPTQTIDKEEMPEIKKFFISSEKENTNLYLTKQEYKTLFYICNGCSMKNIGTLLNISPRTVEAYLQSCKDKLSANYKTDLLAKARKIGVNKLFIDL